MPRVILKEQPDYEFKFITKIQTEDLNYAGHLANEALLKMIQEARIDLIKKLGFKELDLGDGKTGVIIADLVVNYKSEGFEGDELRIESHIGQITERSIRIFHRIFKNKNDILLTLAETGLVAFNYKIREITKFPEPFWEVLAKF